MVGATFIAYVVGKNLGWDVSALIPKTPPALHTQSQTLQAPVTSASIITRSLVPGAGDSLESGDLVTVHIVMTRDGVSILDTRRRGLPYTFVLGSSEAPTFLSLAIQGLKLHGNRECTVPGSLVSKWNGGAFGTTAVELKVEVIDAQLQRVN